MQTPFARPGLAFASFSLLFAIAAFLSPGLPSPDLAGITIWTVLVSGLGWSSWRVARNLTPRREIIEVVLSASLLWIVAASSIVAYIGFFGALSLGSQALAVAGICLLAATLPSPVTAETRPRSVSTSWESTATITVSVYAALACTVSALNYLRYTKADSDNMWYHLPMVAEWVRTGSIWPSDSIPLIARAYPGFRQAAHTFLAIPVSSEHLEIIGLFERALFGLVLYALVRRIGARPLLAVAIGACAATTPNADPAGNDLMMGITFALGCLFLFSARGFADALLAGLALGGLACTKYSGVMYASLVLAAYVAVVLARNWFTRRERFSASLRILVVTGVFLIAVALPWYLRNEIAFGNPVYPAQIEVGTTVLFEGPIAPEFFDEVTLGFELAPLLGEWRKFLRGFGPVFPVVLISFLWFAVLVFLRRRPVLCLVWFLLPPLCFIAYLNQPYTKQRPYLVGQTRYLIPCYVTLLAALASAAAGARRPVMLSVAGVLSTGSVINVALWTHYWPAMLAISIGFGLATKIAGGRLSSLAFTARPAIVRVLAAGSFALLFVLAAGTERVRTRLQYSSEYGYRDADSAKGWGPVSQFVHRTLSGERILVTGDDRFFPMYGDRFENDVYLWMPEEPDADSLLHEIDARKSTFVVCFPPKSRPEQDRYEFGESLGVTLLDRYPHRFRLSFESRGSHVLEVVRRAN